MAEVQENYIKFGYVTTDEMQELIADGKVNQYDIIFTKDTNEQFIISSSLTPVPIKSRIRIYSSTSAAITDLNTTTQTYAGELVSIYNGSSFAAYIVNKDASGKWDVTPVNSDAAIDYNELSNKPITQLYGSDANPVVLANTVDGNYKVYGKISTPDGGTVNSLIGNYVIIETFNDVKKITRIGTDTICNYSIQGETITTSSYITKEYLDAQGYATETYVSEQMTAFKVAMEQYVKDYIQNTMTALIQYLIEQELDSRYASDDDIEDLFD